MSDIKLRLSRKMVIPFGTYKGCLVEDILSDDPGWLLWAETHIEGWELEQSLREQAEDAKASSIVPEDHDYLDEVPY